MPAAKIASGLYRPIGGDCELHRAALQIDPLAIASIAVDAPAAKQLSGKWVALICGGVLLTFAIVAYCSFQHTAATIDEPLHAVGAYQHVFFHDYRINPEDPPLWNYLSMLPHFRGELRDQTPPWFYQQTTVNILHSFQITSKMLYMTPGNNGPAFINASRTMMIAAGLALGIVVSAWAYRLAGAAAAIAACILFGFDPNFLAHTALLKNDVAISLCLLCVAWAVCAMGRRLTWLNLVVGFLAIAAAPVIKFSGVLVVIIAMTLLLIRALLPTAWPMFGRELTTRGKRVLAVMGLSFCVAVACALSIWACYAFRFEPTPEPGLIMKTDLPIRDYKRKLFHLENDRWPSEAEFAALPMPLPARAEQFAEGHHLLPQGWLFGMLFTYETTLMRESFLLGERYESGHWYYFPCAMLFKTPLATLAAMLLAVGSFLIWRKADSPITLSSPQNWTLLCIAGPLAIYGLSALTTNLNLGIRHILPIYPFIYLLLAMRIRTLLPQSPKLIATLAGVLLLGLAGETLLASPHYISFFNAAARPYRLHLLSDSNFDWGQDLPYVADWQQAHPDVPLYLGYWCAADPAFYGIDYHNLPGGYVFGPEGAWPKADENCVLAIPATLLQGNDCDIRLVPKYAEIRAHRPREILGDSIYLYDWPLK